MITCSPRWSFSAVTKSSDSRWLRCWNACRWGRRINQAVHLQCESCCAWFLWHHCFLKRYIKLIFSGCDEVLQLLQLSKLLLTPPSALRPAALSSTT